MKAQPCAGGYKIETYNTNGKEKKLTSMQQDELGVRLPPLSQVDCLGLHRVDVDVLTKEHDEKMANLRNRYKQITTTRPVKEREFGFSRRKKKNPDFVDGKVPPISQIVMGSQHEVPWWTSERPMRNVNSTRLLPISQVSCLSVCSENEQPEARKQSKRDYRSKFEINEWDSEYVKLAKRGGQPNLLHYMEATPPRWTLDNKHYPESNNSLQIVKSKSDQEPAAWKPSQWAALSPIKKADNRDGWRERK